MRGGKAQAGWRLREVEGSRCGDHVDVAMVGGTALWSEDRGNDDSGRNQFQGQRWRLQRVVKGLGLGV